MKRQTQKPKTYIKLKMQEIWEKYVINVDNRQAFQVKFSNEVKQKWNMQQKQRDWVDLRSAHDFGWKAVQHKKGKKNGKKYLQKTTKSFFVWIA